MKPVLCDICKEFFGSWKRLDIHEKKIHGIGMKEQAYCEKGSKFCLDQNCGCVNNRYYRNEFRKARKERKRNETLGKDQAAVRQPQEEAGQDGGEVPQSCSDKG